MKRFSMKPAVLLPIVVLALSSSTVWANKDYNRSTATTTTTTTHSSNAKNGNGKEQMQADPIQIILKDHQHVQQLIGKVDKSLNAKDDNRDAFKEFKDFITKHETMEQKVWYPELEKKDQLKEVIAHLKKEEDAASSQLEKIDGMTDQKEYSTNVKKVLQDVKHHAKEEETKLFPKVKQAFNKAELNDIGNKLIEYRNDNDMKY